MLTAVILFHCLYVLHIVTVFGSSSRTFLDPQVVDLLSNIHWLNGTDNPGVIPTQGLHSYSPAYLFEDFQRNVQLDPTPLELLKPLVVHGHREMTILAAVKQAKGNTGSIVTMCSGQNRIFELQSSGRRDEIRLRYLHNHTVHIETFPYQLADNRWHKVAIAISSNEVTVHIDCISIYQRLIPSIDWTLNRDKLKVWIGQRRRRHAGFKGKLQDVKVVSGSHGYLVQCPKADTACPTCGQFAQLEKMVQELYSHIEILNAKLISTEKRLTSLESCDCSKSCIYDQKKYQDGTEWQENCTTCKCQNGTVECTQMKCPATHCKHPMVRDGECCPVCLRSCMFQRKSYDHNETACLRRGKHFVCKDGKMKSNPHGKCPKLDCSEENQVYFEKDCCKKCTGINYCEKGHSCHSNATCINLKTRYECQCYPGFLGDGYHCQDVNECLEKGGESGNHCDPDSTICTNIPGSYLCQCKDGFTRVDEYNCQDRNECDSGEHGCHENAVCKNTIGSYKCECLPGYHGYRNQCKPMCSIPCMNGGTCIKPDQCQCRAGYGGLDCQQDLDECSLGIANCYNSSECVNLPGWYYCKCKDGYKSANSNNKNGQMCEDLNECLGEGTGHTCHPSSVCINTEGGYYCNCSENSVSKCYNSCMFRGIEYASGAVWKSDNERCSTCSCKDGVMKCSVVECDCKSNYFDMDCCPQCDVTKQCLDPETGHNYTNGQRWFEGCEQCECLNEEIDCWPVKCPHLPCQQVQQSKDECCPKCLDDSLNTGELSKDPCSKTYDGPVPLWNTSCTHSGLSYQHGDIFWLADDPCVICECKVGHTCCSFNGSCNSSNETESENNIKSGITEKIYTDQDFTVQVFEERSEKKLTQDVRLERKLEKFSNLTSTLKNTTTYGVDQG